VQLFNADHSFSQVPTCAWVFMQVSVASNWLLQAQVPAWMSAWRLLQPLSASASLTGLPFTATVPPME
jgi:hypothetical protein